MALLLVDCGGWLRALCLTLVESSGLPIFLEPGLADFLTFCRCMAVCYELSVAHMKKPRGSRTFPEPLGRLI